MSRVFSLALVVVAVFVALVDAQAQIPCKAGPYDLSPIAGMQQMVEWDPASSGSISFAICGAYQGSTCGTQSGINKCSSITNNCTSSCQTWNDEDNDPEGASLGIFSSITYDTSLDVVLITNTGGDATDSGVGRQVIFTISCGAAPLTYVSFTQASPPPPPNGQAYTYYINLTSSYACKKADCSSQTSCSDCSGSAGACTWCLDSNSCIASESVKSKCRSFIGKPQFCPVPNGVCGMQSTCSACVSTKDPYGPCFWCLDDHRCNEGNSAYCSSHIGSMKFCNITQ